MSEKERSLSLLLLTRTIKYDVEGKITSDTTTNHLTNETYQTPKKRKNFTS